MTDLLELADQAWRGETRLTPDGILFARQWGTLAPIGERDAFVAGFSNMGVIGTDAGLVLVDTGSELLCQSMHDALRAWTDAPVHTVVFTHGHTDHVFGVDLYEADARSSESGAPDTPPLQVAAHEAINARFDRYVMTAGYNAVINRRQFSVPNLEWPVEYRRPDLTYRDALVLEPGGERIELHHDRGETDDHTWVWVPGRKTLLTGDLFVWVTPNCGNPQKVQRYPLDWARAFHKMAVLGAETLLPGHGLPILGEERIRTTLLEAAAVLESLHDQTVAMMNEGARLDDIVHTVRAPADLIERPYLRPVYDEPEFIVRNIWRLYGGWYDGNPANLKPAPEAAIATELAGLSGGAERLAARARELAEAGDFRLACHLAEWAALAAPDDDAIRGARAEVYAARLAQESSLMAQGIYRWASKT
jgi:alkyl sulfatase BDS1-like metallo-beta-lactamase superfamily hydrolase